MGSNPTRAALFFFSEKKELFGLVALPFFLFIGLEFSCHVTGSVGVTRHVTGSVRHYTSCDCNCWSVGGCWSPFLAMYMYYC